MKLSQLGGKPVFKAEAMNYPSWNKQVCVLDGLWTMTLEPNSNISFWKSDFNSDIDPLPSRKVEQSHVRGCLPALTFLTPPRPATTSSLTLMITHPPAYDFGRRWECRNSPGWTWPPVGVPLWSLPKIPPPQPWFDGASRGWGTSRQVVLEVTRFWLRGWLSESLLPKPTPSAISTHRSPMGQWSGTSSQRQSRPLVPEGPSQGVEISIPLLGAWWFEIDFPFSRIGFFIKGFYLINKP